jgi:hypothetical protein
MPSSWQSRGVLLMAAALPVGTSAPASIAPIFGSLRTSHPSGTRFASTFVCAASAAATEAAQSKLLRELSCIFSDLMPDAHQGWPGLKARSALPWEVRPVPGSSCIVGVEDWAMKKGRTYGSILVDLERRKPIELLPDRTASTFSSAKACMTTQRVVACTRGLRQLQASAAAAGPGP